MLNYLKQKLKPWALKFFDAPIEENEASLKLKKAQGIIEAADKLSHTLGFSTTMKYNTLVSTGKIEYETSVHICGEWLYSEQAYDLIGNLQTAVIDYFHKDLQ